MKDDGAKKPHALYRVRGGSSFVALPADLVDHSVDNIYRRSHCWQQAAQWSGQGDPVRSPSPRSPRSPGLPGAGIRSSSAGREPARHYSSRLSSYDGFGTEAKSPAPGITTFASTLSPEEPRARPRPVSFQEGSIGPRHSIALGLEELTIPRTYIAETIPGTRKTSTPDPTASFDTILNEVERPTRRSRWDSISGSLGGSMGQGAGSARDHRRGEKQVS